MISIWPWSSMLLLIFKSMYIKKKIKNLLATLTLGLEYEQHSMNNIHRQGEFEVETHETSKKNPYT
jgi:hypothetical protein